MTNNENASTDVRAATADDYARVALLIYESHTNSFAPFASAEWVESRDLDEYRAKWQQTLSDTSAGRTTLLVESDEGLIGTVSISPMESADYDAQLHGMHVAPNQTGQGTGCALMLEALRFIERQRYRRIQLGVIASNTGARRFYEAHGWTLEQELPNGIEGVPIATYLLTIPNS